MQKSNILLAKGNVFVFVAQCLSLHTMMCVFLRAHPSLGQNVFSIACFSSIVFHFSRILYFFWPDNNQISSLIFRHYYCSVDVRFTLSASDRCNILFLLVAYCVYARARAHYLMFCGQRPIDFGTDSPTYWNSTTGFVKQMNRKKRCSSRSKINKLNGWCHIKT